MSTAPPPATKNNSVPKLYILGLLLLLIVAAAGIYAWHSKHKSSASTTLPNGVAIPADFTEYKATKYGFMFNYPKAWSVPTISRASRSNHAQYEITFPMTKGASFSIFATLPVDTEANSTEKTIRRNLSQGNNYLKSDSTSYTTALVDPVTKSYGEITVSEVAHLPTLKISGVYLQASMVPDSKCPADTLPATSAMCFSKADLDNISIFGRTIRAI